MTRRAIQICAQELVCVLAVVDMLFCISRRQRNSSLVLCDRLHPPRSQVLPISSSRFSMTIEVINCVGELLRYVIGGYDSQGRSARRSTGDRLQERIRKEEGRTAR